MKRTSIVILALLISCTTIQNPKSKIENQPAQPVHVVIVGTTDVHGWFNGHVDKPRGGGESVQYGGVATLQSYVNALRATNDNNVLLVDSGDLFQGTLESNLFEGEPVVRAYNAMGYAAAAVGNHEFDYGPVGPKAIASDPNDDPLGALKRNASMAQFPFLSANMTDRATGTTPPWAKRWIMTTVGGAKIGIIGLSTPDTPNVTVALNVRTLQFGDPVAATVDAAREARAAGADAVIVIAHMGGRCRDLKDVTDVASCEPNHEAMRYLAALPAGTIDAYFAGHTHAFMRHVINGVPAVQAGSYSTDFSTMDLWIDTQAKHVVGNRTTMRPPTKICRVVYSGTETCDPHDAPANATLVPRVFEGRTIEPDARVAQVVQPFLDRTAAKRNEPLGVTTTAELTRSALRESVLGDLLADALRQEFKADVGFMNSGGIRSNLRAGAISYGDVFEVSPFDNYPAIVPMTGQQLLDVLRMLSAGDRGLLQVSGIKYTVDFARDKDKPVGQRDRLVSATMADGTPIDPAKTYSVVMPDFLAYGGDAMDAVLSAIPPDRIQFYQDRTIRDVLADQLRQRGGTISPRLDGRITVLNAPAPVRE